MTDTSTTGADLASLTPAVLHRLEAADSRLRHSTGLRALGALGALAPLAPARRDKPGFREKLAAARAAAAGAAAECRLFFETPVGGGRTAGDLFSEARAAVFDRLEGLAAVPDEGLAEAVEGVVGPLAAITRAIQAARHSLRAVFERHVDPLAGLCEAGGARLITCDTLPDDPPMFLDDGRLGDALTELVTNAIRHGLAGRRGTVRLELGPGPAPGEVRLVVADDGGGIPEAVRDRVLERGVSTGGSGEGLALVREIVEGEHLGTLAFMTGSGGTRWDLVLPVRVPRDRLEAATDAPGRPPATRAPAPRRRGAARALAVAAALAVLIGLGLLLAHAYRGGPGEADASAPGPAPGGPSVPVQAGPGPREDPVPPGLPREIVHAPTGIPLVLVPAGTFTMGADGGDPTEGPARRVTLTRPVYIGRREVTQAEYERVMGANPSRVRGPDLPVTNVSYVDAHLFLLKAGLRLPTEAEWERAAQGSPAPATPADRPRPAGALAPSPLGLHGMLGNVAEWCTDWYGLYPPGAATDPAGPARGARRVVRGGSFRTARAQLRPTLRAGVDPMERRDTVGLRVVLDIEASPEPNP